MLPVTVCCLVPVLLYSHALSDFDIFLNYRDRDGDLVMIADDDDVALLATEAVAKSSPAQGSYVPWQLHISASDDFSVYHVDPYS